MKNELKQIVLSPIEELFSEKEILDMFMLIKPKLHHCYDHSCRLADYLKKKYPTVEYHEGIYSDFLILHAWNSIVKDGIRHYFDFTGYFLEKSQKIERWGDAILLRTYSPKEIFKLMFEKGIFCCQMENDGSYNDFIEKHCKKQMKEINRIVELNKIAAEYEKKHEILCPCVSC